MNVMGIIFANDASLGALTLNRTMASLPFGGRYRQVDFHLSNMAAAGIHHVGIISRHNYQSLMNHVGSGEEWGMELEEGGLEFLTPYAMSVTDSYRGKLDALHSVMNFLNYGPEDEYVVMDKAGRLQLPGDMLKKLGVTGNRVRMEMREGEICVRELRLDIANADDFDASAL